MTGRPRERGSAIVESALVLLIFVMLFLALSDVARMIYAYNELPYLAREGARYAAVHGSNSSSGALNCGQVITHLKSMAAGLDPTQLTISVNGQTSASSSTALGAAPGSTTVIVSYNLNPVFLKLLGSSTTVSGRSIMPYSQ